MRVEALGLVEDPRPLRLEELVVVCRGGDYGPVDADVGLYGVAAGGVDVEGEQGGAAVEGFIVAGDEEFGRCVASAIALGVRV